MADKRTDNTETEAVLQAIIQRLDEMHADMRTINELLIDLKAVSLKEIEIIRQQQQAAIEARRAWNNAGLLMSGRWPRRDGDTYGIVQAQPKVGTSPLPDARTEKNTVVLPENDLGPLDADHPPRNIRSSHQR